MKTTLKVIGVMLIVFAASILLTPPLAKILTMFRFEKIFNRLIMVFTIAAAVLAVIRSGISLEACGFNFKARWKWLFGLGFLVGGFMVLNISLIELIWGPRYVRDPWALSDILTRFAKGFVGGVAVGIIEEFFFRGFIYKRLEAKMKRWLAVILANVFYAATHFLDNGQIFIPDNPSFKDGVRLLFGYLEPLAFQWAHIGPQFVGLFIFGVVLTMAFLRTRSLFLSIGVHAGAVFVIKWQNAFLRKGPDDFHPFYGSTPVYDGPVEWLVLAAYAFLIYWLAKRYNTENS